MLEGIVTKAIGGFYYVAVGDKIFEATLRGRLKRDEKIYVGDRVKLNVLGESKAVLEELIPRRSLLFRPSVANLDKVVIVFAISQPEPNPLHLDRMLVLAEYSELDIIICLNKCELNISDSKKELFEVYKKIGYPVIFTSAKEGIGLAELDQYLRASLTVFAGPSGVGKSSLLNALQPGLKLKTGELSVKIARGKHTTRHVELLMYGKNGFVVDTPGFGNVRLDEIPSELLPNLFVEFKQAGNCRFQDCRHVQEPGCAVKKAVEDGVIAKSRYENYLILLKEALEVKKTW
ncbi:MAG TPA: ribosome small subunit-dependent GTPase A [Clostridia bacterium]|nr:ribosome small subunit-dependent GTPase A [Clostridia bacterium]